MKNWVYYMQQGLKYMWKSKEVPNWSKKDSLELLEEIDPNDKVFDKKECGCRVDCGCKETKKDIMKGWLP